MSRPPISGSSPEIGGNERIWLDTGDLVGGVPAKGATVGDLVSSMKGDLGDGRWKRICID